MKPNIKNKYTAILGLILALTFFAGSATAFAGGDGTSDDPYQISTCSELESISSDSYFELINDIDCSGYNFDSINQNSIQELDGNSYTIGNLSSSTIRSATYSYGDSVGMFGSLSGTIRNITLSNFDISGSATHGGVIAGDTSSISIIDTTVKDSTVAIDSSSSDTAGVVLGVAESGNINYQSVRSVNNEVLNNPFGSGTFFSFASGSATITVENSRIIDTTIPECGDDCSIIGGWNSGASDDEVIDTLVLGDSQVSNNLYVNQDSGSNYPPVTNSYYDDETTNINDGNAIAETTSYLTGVGTVNDLGFNSNIWSDTLNYPDLSYAVDTSPDFQIIDSSTDAPVDEGETVTVTATIENQGLTAGEKQVEGFIDGNNEYSELITIGSNENTTVSFNKSYGYQAEGTHDYEVTTPDDTETGTFQVNNVDLPDPNAPVIQTPEEGFTVYLENKSGSWGWSETSTGYVNLDQDHPEGVELDLELDDSDCNVGLNPCVGSQSSSKTYTTSGNYSFSFDYGNNFLDTDQGQQYPKSRTVDAYYEITNEEGVTETSGKNTFNIEVVKPPTITNFSTTPNIADAEVGDQFDLAVEGDINTYEFSNITYSLDVTNQQNPSDIVVDNPDFSSSSSFNDQIADAFEYKDSYQGETVTLSATVSDVEGNTDTESISASTEVEPDNFVLNSPEDGEIFLIPEGETSTDITYDYGIDTNSNEGTLELVVDGSVASTHSVNADSSPTFTHTQTLNEGEYSWKLRFTDSVTGNVYESSTRSFDVADEPFALTLDSPKGDTFNLLNSSTTNIDHEFFIDARATNEDFYYQFILENDTSGNTLNTVTSETLNFNTQSFTETINDLGDGEYKWNVEIYLSSDNSLQESRSATYTIVESPEYNSNLVEPYDGKQFYVDPGENQRDVDASFTVESFKESVDTELVLDGNVVDSRTISSNSDETVDLTLSDVSTGSHTLTLNSEDESGRTQSETNNFEVLQEDEANVTLNELSTDPDLNRLTPSDEEFNIYFEAENKTEVEYVDVEVDVNGTTEHTVRVPKDELIIGSVSLLETIDLERDLGYNYNQLQNSDISVSATVFDGLQQSYRWSRSFAFGISDPLPVQESPTDGKKFNETSGNPEEHRLGYKIEMANEDVLYRVYVNDTQVDFGTATETGGTFRGETFVNVVEDLGYDQFGEFNWHVNITEEVTNYETSTGEDTFSILNASENDVILSFNNPEKDKPYLMKNNIEKRSVPFGFTYESEVSGNIKLKVQGDIESTIYDEDVDAGSDTETFSKNLPVGSYSAKLIYTKENGEKVTEERFFTVRKDTSVPEDRVFVDAPSPDERLYEGERTSFSWGVNSSGGNGETWFEIRDDTSNTVENYSESYEDYDEVAIYGRNIGTLGLGSGEYTAQAFFKRNGDTVQSSNNVSFTVVDFDKPNVQNYNSIENNTVYTENNPINFSVDAKTFESAATATIKYRHLDEYESFNIAQRDYEAFETATIDGVKRFEPGRYAWYVQFDVNPTFTTEERYFTVESTDIPEPEFSLNNPEQNQTITIDSDNSTNVTFDYDAEVFTSSEAEVNLLLSSRSDGLTNFKQRATDLQVKEDGVQNYVKELDLEEDGYLYKIEAVYNNGTYQSDSVGFAVDDPSTEEEPEAPSPEEGVKKSNFLNSAIEYLASFLGVGFGGLGSMVQIVIASLITVVAGGIVNNWTESAEIGLMSMMVSIFIFVIAGWLPTWVGIILFMLSSAIFIYALRRVHGGR